MQDEKTPPRNPQDKPLTLLIIEGLSIDGAHHKQWYLFQIAKLLGIPINEDDFDPGIAP